ncbi:MAG: hypothetical protein ABFQ65_03645 [Nanoarchaeota archaeon]
MEDISQKLDEFSKHIELLNGRYEECDDKGHKEVEENYCNHCYRHLSYSTPKTNQILESRKNIPLYHQPFDAPILMEKRREEINHQKFMDHLEGLKKIKEELER